MLTAENVTGTAHIGCQLIKLIKLTYRSKFVTKNRIPQITKEKLVCRSFPKFRSFYICPNYIIAFVF